MENGYRHPPDDETNRSTKNTGFIESYFPALKVRSYAYYFSGQSISVTGLWMQIVAQGWLVYELTHKASYLGIVQFSRAVPMILLSLWGGKLADRFSKRNLLMFSNAVLLLQASAFAALTLTGVITVEMIMALAVFGGAVMALEAPTRQSMVVELVGPDKVANAVALNSVLFNSARVIGPSVAGVVLAAWGPGQCFAVNAVTFLAVVFALSRIPNTGVPDTSEQTEEDKRQSIWGYLKSQPPIFAALTLLVSSSFLAFAWMSLMPVVADRLFGQGAAGYAALVTASGVGSLTAGLYIIARKGKDTSGRTVIMGVFLMATGLIAVSLSRHMYIALPFVFAVGLGTVTCAANINALLQRNVRSDMRGRTFGLYSIAIMGFMPVGSLALGALIDLLGVMPVMIGAACSLAIIALTITVKAPGLRKLR